MVLLFVVVTLGLTLGVPFFATPGNLLDNVLRKQAHLAVLAAGMTLVILTGGIDLSVGSIVALAAVALGVVWSGTHNALLALAAALGMGAFCGAINGALVAKGRVPPLIVTLATLSIFRGSAFALGGSSSVGQFDPLIRSFSTYNIAGLPAPVWTFGLLFIGAGIYLARTDGGRAIYAVGANPVASRLAGVPVDGLKFRLYLVSGLLAGLAAILYAAQNNSVRADIGAEYELMAITMVVLGGTSVAGGEGSMLGTALGFLTLVFIQNGMQLKSQIDIGNLHFPLPTEIHGVVVAALLIGALLLDAGFRKRALGK